MKNVETSLKVIDVKKMSMNEQLCTAVSELRLHILLTFKKVEDWTRDEICQKFKIQDNPEYIKQCFYGMTVVLQTISIKKK